MKLLEGCFVRDALGLQAAAAPNQSSSVRRRAEPFTQCTSQKEHEEGTALSNKKRMREKVVIQTNHNKPSVRVHEFWNPR